MRKWVLVYVLGIIAEQYVQYLRRGLNQRKSFIKLLLYLSHIDKYLSIKRQMNSTYFLHTNRYRQCYVIIVWH